MTVRCRTPEKVSLNTCYSSRCPAEKNSNDCDRMANELRALIRSKSALMKEMTAADKDPKAKAFFEKHYGKELEKLASRMIGAMSKCMDNENLQKALDEAFPG